MPGGGSEEVRMGDSHWESVRREGRRRKKGRNERPTFSTAAVEERRALLLSAEATLTLILGEGRSRRRWRMRRGSPPEEKGEGEVEGRRRWHRWNEFLYRSKKGGGGGVEVEGGGGGVGGVSEGGDGGGGGRWRMYGHL